MDPEGVTIEVDRPLFPEYRDSIDKLVSTSIKVVPLLLVYHNARDASTIHSESMQLGAHALTSGVSELSYGNNVNMIIAISLSEVIGVVVKVKVGGH